VILVGEAIGEAASLPVDGEQCGEGLLRRA
jgi:hypothetical protein